MAERTALTRMSSAPNTGRRSSRSSTSRARGNQTAWAVSMRARSAGEGRDSSEMSIDDHVLTAGGDFYAGEAQRILQALDAEVTDRVDAAAKDTRRDAHHQTIAKPCLEHRRDDAGAALDQQRANATDRKQPNEVSEIDPTLGVTIRLDDIDSQASHCRALRFGCLVSRHDHRGGGLIPEDIRIQR